MSDARIGSEVAGYRIVSVLGQGGMGTVYLAEQTSPRRNVVVKLLRPDLSRDEAFRQRFVHESEAAASTEHPNIVPIYSAGEADGVLYIAMRYVEGDDLRHLISNRGPLPPDRAIEIVSQIASALDVAHARGLVHRDVKPGNILLDEGGNAYLSDFGLIKRSTVDTGLTETGQFMGSIEYCAPEQIRGDEVDGRADVYSLACVLYESIAGRPPFQRDTEVATLYAHLEQDPPRLASDGSGPVRELDPVVAKAMAKRPSDRYASAGEFARAARHVAGVTSGERQAAAPRSPRGRILLVAGALAAALAAAGLALALSSGDDGTPPSDPAATGSLTNVVQRIDPRTGEVMQSIGGINQKAENLRVSGFAAGEGGLWVTNFANLQHVDPVSGTVRANVSIQSPFLTPIVAFRIVWIATDDAVERINPATDELLRPIGLEQLSGIAIPPYIAAGEGAVWVVLDKVLSQIDPATNEIVHETTPVPGSTGIAVGEGAVWVIDKLTGSLTAIDPATGEARASADLPGNLDDVVAGGGSVWVLDRAVGTVSVVDPQTLTEDATVRVGDEEQNLVFGAGAVWLADGPATTLSRIDPVTRELTTYPMAGPVVDVAVDQDTGTLWVLISDSGDANPKPVAREPIRRTAIIVGVASKRKRAKREADPLAAYRRIRKPMPPPERIVPDKRRVLDQDEARREIEEER
jgi:streptogramin lyase